MRLFIFLLGLCVTNISYSQKEYISQIGDTLVKIKLLSESRVLIEEYPKQEIEKKEPVINIVPEEKSYCGGFPNAIYYYPSYGTYEIKNDSIFLSFKYENPIENIEIIALPNGAKNTKSNLYVAKPINAFYDLKLSQNKTELMNLMWDGQTANVEIENIAYPLIVDYNDSVKEVTLETVGNYELKITVNELKGSNYRENETMIFKMEQLSEVNKR